MPSAVEPPDSSESDASWQQLEEIVKRFEAAWRGGRQPVLEDFLPAGEAERWPVLVELVYADLEWRRIFHGKVAPIKEEPLSMLYSYLASPRWYSPRWYHEGIVYDHDGYVVVAPASAFRNPVGAAPPRGLKNLKPLKGLKELKPLKPLFGRSWSKLPARAFFFMGLD